MPSNKPFIKSYLQRFLAWINNWRRTPVEEAVDEATKQMPGTMQVMSENHPISEMGLDAQEANFLKLLTRLLSRQPHDQPMKALDIGTFVGRSALAIAQAMPDGGKVITCDINPEYMNTAKKYWQDAGVDDRIEPRLGRATDTLDGLANEAGTFDLVFIDAKKEEYQQYYEKALELLRPGGLIVLDNMLWSGHVAQPRFYDPDNKSKNKKFDTAAQALRDLNIGIAKDKNVEAVLLSFADGVMVAEKCAPGHFAAIAEESKSRHKKGRSAA